MILNKLSYVYIFCLHETKSKSNLKNYRSSCSQGLYKIIEYADSEYDAKNLSYVFICYFQKSFGILSFSSKCISLFYDTSTKTRCGMLNRS